MFIALEKCGFAQLVPCSNGPRAAAVLVLAVLLTAAAPRTSIGTTLESEDLSGNAAGGVVFVRNPGSTSDFSPDGRFVLFTSTATDLVAGVTDSNGIADVFHRDLQEGTTSILSVDADGNALGTIGSNLIGGFVFSPDSARLVFRSQATNVVAGLADTNTAPDWFVRNLLEGTTECVSINSAGTSTGNLTSFANESPVFSPDGKSLAFVSIAGDLVAGVTDTGGRDMFLRDFEARTTSLISVTTSGGASGRASEDPAHFSPDGRYLEFIDGGADLVAGVSDTNNGNDLFVRDLETDTTFMVTRGTDDVAASFFLTYGWTPDGEALLFTSGATSLVSGVTDTNNGIDVFQWHPQSDSVSILSVDTAGTATGDKASHFLDISPDSRYVAFASASANLTPESDGDVLQDLYLRDTQTNTTTFITGNQTSSVTFAFARFSPDGEHLLYESDESDEIPGVADTNGNKDLYLYDLATGVKSCVTINAEGTATSNTVSVSDDDVVVSPNGRYISFVSDATDLVEDFTGNSTRDLYVRDVVAGVTSLVTAGLQGQGVGYDQGATRDAEFSPDNRFLVFTDNALIASPVTTVFNFNFGVNLYAFDLVARLQNLLSTNAAGDRSGQRRRRAADRSGRAVLLHREPGRRVGVLPEHVRRPRRRRHRRGFHLRRVPRTAADCAGPGVRGPDRRR